MIPTLNGEGNKAFGAHLGQGSGQQLENHQQLLARCPSFSGIILQQ
jgi:hypothetical protein